MALLVNGDLITDEMIEQHRALLLDAAHSEIHDPRLRYAAEENAVLRTLLQQTATHAAIPVSSSEIAAELEKRHGYLQSSFCSPAERASVEQELRVERFVAQVTRHVPRPSRRQVELSYQQQRSRFAIPASAHVQHIICNVDEFTSREAALSRMQEAERCLAAGELFGTVATRFSDCPGEGGDMGWIERGTMVEEFDEVIFSGQLGTRTEIFETRFGLHIALIRARRAERVQSLDEVRPSLSRELWEMDRRESLRQYLREKAAAADIQVVELRRRVEEL